MASQQWSAGVLQPHSVSRGTSRNVQPDDAHLVQGLADLDVNRGSTTEGNHPAAFDRSEGLPPLHLAEVRLSLDEEDLRDVAPLDLLDESIDVDELLLQALSQERPHRRLAGPWSTDEDDDTHGATTRPRSARRPR